MHSPNFQSKIDIVSYCFCLSVFLSGLAVLPFAHHSQGPVHCLKLQQCLLQGRPQCLWDRGVLQCSMPAARPALSRPAANQRQWLRRAVLPAGRGPEPQVCAGVQLHAQSLFLWPLFGLSGQPNTRTYFSRNSDNIWRPSQFVCLFDSC